MPNLLGAPWKKANLNEYLAQCFLSALGVSVPVQRQEDIGIDFYCALSEESDLRLTFHSPFTVQCGSAARKDFVYGGFTDSGRWRKEARDWLFEQQVPFFACTVSAKEARFRLYQTSAKWMVRNECGHLNMSAVELMPEAKFDPVLASIPRERIAKDTDVLRGCDGQKYGIPLREPVVDLVVQDLTNKERLDSAREAVRKAVDVERENITYNHDLEIFISDWFTAIVPNDASQFQTAYGITYNRQQNAHLGPVLESLQKSAIVLALNLQAQNKQAEIGHLAPLFRLFPRDSVALDLLRQLPPQVIEHLTAPRT